MRLDVQIGVDTYVDTRESVKGVPRGLVIEIVFGVAQMAQGLARQALPRAARHLS